MFKALGNPNRLKLFLNLLEESKLDLAKGRIHDCFLVKLLGGLELGDPAARGGELGAQPEDDRDAGPVDVELAQRARREHAVEVDGDAIVVALLDDALVDQPRDQLVVAVDQLDQALVSEARRRHSVSPSRTGFEYAFALARSAAASASSAWSGIRTSSSTNRSPRLDLRSTPLPRNRRRAWFCERGGILSTTVPSNVGTSTLAPLYASSTVTGSVR
jgi:hypothetical protein